MTKNCEQKKVVKKFRFSFNYTFISYKTQIRLQSVKIKKDITLEYKNNNIIKTGEFQFVKNENGLVAIFLLSTANKINISQ